MESIEAFVATLNIYVPYAPLIPFIGAFVGGEEIIIAVAILAASTGLVSFKILFVASCAGTIASDLCWFIAGKHLMPWFEKRPRISKGIELVSHFVTRVSRGNLFWALLITKFLYGTRITMLFYLAKRRLSLAQFLAYNSAVTVIWATVICSIGWFAGRGIINIVTVFDDLTLGLGIVALLLFIFYAIRLWLNKVIIEEETTYK